MENTRMFNRLLAVAIGALLLIASSGGAVSASSWTLVDNHQSTCYYPPNGTTNYYPVWLSGSWSHPISVSISGAPAGSSTWTYDSPIEPGSSNGSGSLAYVALHIANSTPTGSYTAQLTATDGSSTQSVDVGVVVRTSCSRA
jgi:hypothetical protein